MRKTSNTKSRIVDAAWKLFYEQGYEDTTIEQIIYESGTSRGSFYHYFTGKDALLGSMALLFDEKYEELSDTLDPAMDTLDALFYLSHELFVMIERRVDMDLLTRMMSTQLTKNGEKQLLDHNRTYYRMLRTILTRGQERGEVTRERSVAELVRLYAMVERGILYDWCLYRGEFSLPAYGDAALSTFCAGLRATAVCEGAPA